MAKYSLEIKLKAVSDVLNLGMSAKSVAKNMNTAQAVVRRWVLLYKNFGPEGLTKKNGTYTGDFKLHVVKYIHENNMSLIQGAVHFGIPNDTTVGNWERIYWEEGPLALYKENRGRKYKNMKKEVKKPNLNKHTEEDLIAEVQRLRMENEYLKKLNALVQSKEKSLKKTK